MYYCIQIKEQLDSHWVAWFEDMRLSQTESGTLLEGTLVDPAALYGLIGKLRDLGLTLLAVNTVVAEHSHEARRCL
jgi:hypothetical protein